MNHWLGSRDPVRTLAPNWGVARGDPGKAVLHVPTSRGSEGEAMTQLDRTVWTAPVRNLVWVAAQFGHR